MYQCESIMALSSACSATKVSSSVGWSDAKILNKNMGASIRPCVTLASIVEISGKA